MGMREMRPDSNGSEEMTEEELNYLTDLRTLALDVANSKEVSRDLANDLLLHIGYAIGLCSRLSRELEVK